MLMTRLVNIVTVSYFKTANHNSNALAATKTSKLGNEKVQTKAAGVTTPIGKVKVITNKKNLN